MSSADNRNQSLFLEHARPGMIGLVGGASFIDRTIRKSQRSMRAFYAGAPRSLFSHAFICSGIRADGRHWVLESDLDFARKIVRLGVQENRAERYFSAEEYPNIALLDFALSTEQTKLVLTAALDLLAGQTGYSLREILGTLLAVQKPRLRTRNNLFEQNHALYCSAMVQHCYQAVGLALMPGIPTKNTMPEDLSASPLAHQRFEVIRSR
jgi:hypothetical protein